MCPPHDRRQMRSLVLQQLQILERIATDNQQIRAGTGHQLAELSLTLQDLGVDPGRRADDLARRFPLPFVVADQGLAALLLVQRAKQVGAEADLNAGGNHQGETERVRWKPLRSVEAVSKAVATLLARLTPCDIIV